MEYRIGDGDGAVFDGGIVRNLGNSEYVIRIGDREHNVRILSADRGGIEFILGRGYHRAKYVEGSTAGMRLVVDGVPMDVGMHPGLDKVVYKNSGGAGAAGAGGAQAALKSQIPGKVISVAVEEGAPVAKGDVVCTLESMKMQVGVKAHKDGSVRSVRVKEGDSVAKNDVIAEIE